MSRREFDVSNPFDRKAAETTARNIIAKSDADRIKAAKEFFNDKQKFQEAIESSVLPSLVSIRTCNNKRGSGFFRHPQWLVSNAHIFPSSALLKGASFMDWRGNTFNTDLKESYHRPNKNNKAPDIVIANITRSTGEGGSLPIEFTRNPALEETILFYIELKPDTQTGYVVKPLLQLSEPNTLPMIYKCLDGSEPQPGSSGSPIIKARVIYEPEPRWHFELVSVLYARCSADWHNDNNPAISISFTEEAKLICAIPVGEDFLRIFNILQNKEMVIRCNMMAEAHSHLGNDQAAKNSSIEGEKFQLLTQHGFQAFEAGVTNLNITLPKGLEKLYYDEPVSIAKSLLLFDVLKSIVGKKSAKKYCKKRFKRELRPSVEDLEADLKSFIRSIGKTVSISLHTGNNTLNSQKGYFRVDISGGKSADWQLDIQDNTNAKGINGYIKNAPMSSVFARINIPLEKKKISGTELAELFKNFDLLKALYSEDEISQSNNTPHKKPRKKQKNLLEVIENFSSVINETNSAIRTYCHSYEGKNYLIVQINLNHKKNKTLLGTLEKLFNISFESQSEEFWIPEEVFEKYNTWDAGEISRNFWLEYCELETELKERGEEYNALPLPPPSLPPPPIETQKNNSKKDLKASEEDSHNSKKDFFHECASSETSSHESHSDLPPPPPPPEEEEAQEKTSEDSEKEQQRRQKRIPRDQFFQPKTSTHTHLKGTFSVRF